jgi:hypothetical protein
VIREHDAGQWSAPSERRDAVTVMPPLVTTAEAIDPGLEMFEAAVASRAS